MKERAYIAIDLKSFFASVECRERGLDPLDTISSWRTRAGRTRPSAWPSRHAQALRLSGQRGGCSRGRAAGGASNAPPAQTPGQSWKGTSHFSPELQAKSPGGGFHHRAPPRMAYYMAYSSRHLINLPQIRRAGGYVVVYSIDEVFMD